MRECWERGRIKVVVRIFFKKISGKTI